MVVSRGLKKLRPIVRTVWPPSRIVASGFALLAVPGSLSRAYWARNSLKSRLVRIELTDPFNVSVLTTESPVCSNAFWGPPASPPPPV